MNVWKWELLAWKEKKIQQKRKTIGLLCFVPCKCFHTYEAVFICVCVSKFCLSSDVQLVFFCFASEMLIVSQTLRLLVECTLFIAWFVKGHFHWSKNANSARLTQVQADVHMHDMRALSVYSSSSLLPIQCPWRGMCKWLCILYS